MKKALLLFSVFSLIVYFSSCRKCYTCTNECTQCIRYDSVLTTLSDTVNNVVRTYDTTLVYKRDNMHCTDDATKPTREEYLLAIEYEVDGGATCTAHAPTYNFDFCINKSGSGAYPDYFDRGGRAPCVEKK